MNSPRPLSAMEFSDVLRLNVQCIPGVAKLDRPELARLVALPNAHHTIADADSTVVGYALAFPDDAAYDGEEFLLLQNLCPRPFLYVDQVAVDTSARRKRVALTLYSTMQTHARSAGMVALCCEVNVEPPNPASKAFHKAMGFKELQKLDTADGRTVALMSKRLERDLLS